MSDTLTVNVTAEDIAHGAPGSPRGCPIAVAIKRGNPEYKHVSVGGMCATLVKEMSLRGADNDGKTYRLPAEAVAFIIAFDNHEHVKPLAFTAERYVHHRLR